MLLELTADQQSLRDTTARFLAQTVPVDRLRQLHKQPAGYDGDYWRQGAALGWTSLLVSAEAGGGNVSGQPAVDATLLAYEFGRHSAPGPFLSSNLVAAALDGERPRRHHDVLQGLLDGSVVASWCFVEPHQHDLGPAGISFDITVDGGEVVLNGIKSPVEAGVRPCYLLVTGRSPDGPTQVLVPPGVAGLTLTPMESVDLTRRFSSARFDQVRLPFDAVVGGPGDAGDQLERQLRHALVLQSAESVGAMQRAFDMTVQWAFDRYSFGRPLASYQELKHRFADMKTCLEASHAIVSAAAAAVDADRADASELASVASAYVGQNGTEMLQDCVQMHGGVGLTYEHDLHLLLRRATLNRVLLGTPAVHRRRIAALLETEDVA